MSIPSHFVHIFILSHEMPMNVFLSFSIGMLFAVTSYRFSLFSILFGIFSIFLVVKKQNNSMDER